MPARQRVLLIASALAATALAGIAVGRWYQYQQTQAKLDGYWRNAREEVYKSARELAAQDLVERQNGLHYRKLIRGNHSLKQIALTFDDGPHPAYTPRLLEILDQYGVKATFFVVGEMAARYPDLVRSEIAGGHTIGNHTFYHVDLTRIPNDDVATEIQACGDVLTAISGSRPSLFRPPGGDYDSQVAEIAGLLGYTLVLWTDDPGDYASPGSYTIETRVLERVENGAIVLLHDGVQETLDVLPQILRSLRDQGYTFVTVDTMIRSNSAAGRVK